MFKHLDSADLRLTQEDIKIFKENQARSFREIIKLAKWENAVKIKNKQ